MATWFYAKNEQQIGPVSEAHLRALALRGEIDASTLVWQEGMPEWQPYAQAVKPLPSGSAADSACRECGRRFPESEMIPYGDARICAACKPAFLQKVSEGVVVSGMRYAGFWIRLAAALIDGLILWLVNTAVSFAFRGIASAFSGPGAEFSVAVVTFMINMAFAAAYSVFFVGRFGATPGKMALRLRIVRSDGSRVSYGRALGRYFAEFVSAMILYIGYIMVAFDSEKRALHDHICDTRVVYAR